MPDKMQRFTQRGKRVLTLAQEAAERLQQQEIGTEHILLGLIDEEGGVAGRVLREMGLDRIKVEELIIQKSQPPPRTARLRPDLSPGAKKAIEFAIDESSQMGNHYISTEHLLLGLIRENQGIVIDILKQLSVTPEDIRRKTLSILQEGTESVEPEVAPIESVPLSATELPPAQPQKMQRFTQRAKRVLTLAQEAAEVRQQSYIGTEHVLIGLMREEGGVAGRVLRELGADQRRIEELIDRMTSAQQRVSNVRPDLSPGTKKVIELAIDEARRMGNHYIGTEHLLLGLTRQNEGIAIDILKRMNIGPDAIRRQARRALQENPPGSTPIVSTDEPDNSRLIQELPAKTLVQRHNKFLG